MFYSPKFTRKSGRNIALSVDQLILGQAPSGTTRKTSARLLVAAQASFHCKPSVAGVCAHEQKMMAVIAKTFYAFSRLPEFRVASR